MRIERNLVPESTLEDFATRHGLVMQVTERGLAARSYTGQRFHASFKGVEIGQNGMLCSSFGNGNTEAEAIANYAHVISEQKLIIDAMRPTRREIQAPRLRMGEP